MKLIKLTFAHNKTEFFLNENMIRSVERNAGNLLTTIVGTTMMTQQGPINFEVMESPQDIVDAVNGTTTPLIQ